MGWPRLPHQLLEAMALLPTGGMPPRQAASHAVKGLVKRNHVLVFVSVAAVLPLRGRQTRSVRQSRALGNAQLPKTYMTLARPQWSMVAKANAVQTPSFR